MSNEFLRSLRVPSPWEIEKERSWIEEQIIEIGVDRLKVLIEEAVRARARAYKPYSDYPVGAAILCNSGNIFSAPNTEVVTFTQTGHAEHNAINKAISEGEGANDRRFIKALVVSHSEGSESCGACRQEMLEHCENAVVISIDQEGKPIALTSLKILLPYAFSPSNLIKE